MEALSRSGDAEGDWGSTGVQIDIPLSEVIVCISTVFMNVCSPSVPVMLPSQRPEQNQYFNLILYQRHLTPSSFSSQESNVQCFNVIVCKMWVCSEPLFGCARLHVCNSIMLLENIPC